MTRDYDTISLPGVNDVKESGLNNLAVLVEQASEAVIRNKLVRIAAPCMVDTAALTPEARLAAVGALKNLSIVSPDVCDEMVQQVRSEIEHVPHFPICYEIFYVSLLCSKLFFPRT